MVPLKKPPRMGPQTPTADSRGQTANGRQQNGKGIRNTPLVPYGHGGGSISRKRRTLAQLVLRYMSNTGKLVVYSVKP